MDSKKLKGKTAVISEKGYDSWAEETENHGDNSPNQCPTKGGGNNPTTLDSQFTILCGKCHSDLCLYEEHPDNIK